jgi:predicted secreted protein
MATLTGNDGAITVGSTTVANTKNFSVEIKADTIETSVMGNDTRAYVKGLSTFSGSADIYFDATEFDGAETTFNPTTGAVGDAPIAVKLYLKQDATNDLVFTGNIVVTGYSVKSSFDGLVEASISFQGTGGTTFSATGNV